MALQLQRSKVQIRGPAAPQRARVARVVCQATPEHDNKLKHAALAGVVASALLLGSAVMPDEALAARSGGRVSSSSFSSRKAAPRAAPRSSTTVNSYSTTVVAPPVVGGFGYGYGMPFFGGWGFGPTFIMPFPFMGGLLQIMFLLLIVNVVFGIVKGAINAAGSATKKKDDDWDQL